MVGYIYILRSLKNGKTYTGSTDNIERRMAEHNSGKVASTCRKRPLEIIYTEEFKTLKEARIQERYYKSCAGRKRLKEIYKKQ